MDLPTPTCSSASILPTALHFGKLGTATRRWAGAVSLTDSGLMTVRRDFQDFLFLPSRWFWSGEGHLVFGCHFTPWQGNGHPAANAAGWWALTSLLHPAEQGVMAEVTLQR